MTNCIYFDRPLNGYGYGVVFIDGRMTKAHRAAWVQANGPIPEGLVVDHLCHTQAVERGECEGGKECKHRGCINVDHLRLITQQENIKAGKWSIDNRSHCYQGHPFIKENIMIRKNGRRECAECNRERSRRNWANRKAGV